MTRQVDVCLCPLLLLLLLPSSLPTLHTLQTRSALASMIKQQTAAGLPPEDCHVVFCGDLNSGRQEGVITLLTTGWLPAGYMEAHLPQVRVLPERGEDVSQPYLLADVYASKPLPFTRKVSASTALSQQLGTAQQQPEVVSVILAVADVYAS